MARLIEPTPTLKGRDAERFFEIEEKSKYDPKKAMMIEEARRTYRSVKKRWKSFPSHISEK